MICVRSVVWLFSGFEELQGVDAEGGAAGGYGSLAPALPTGAVQKQVAGKDGKAPAWKPKAVPLDEERMQIYWIDNARFWLETMVIGKHLMVYLGTLYRWDTWWQPGIASFMESFMMPMFSCCSGFLSKGDPTPERALRVIFRAWIPFAIINVFYQWIDGGFMSLWTTYFDMLNCLEVTWFLSAWIQWRLILPYLCSLPPTAAIGAAYIISWMGGYWFIDEPTFHQAEVVGFLPYVVTGYVLKLEHIQMLDKKWIRQASYLTLGTLFVALMAFSKATFSGSDVAEYQKTHFNIYNYYWWMRQYNRSFYYANYGAEGNPGYWGFWTVRAVGQIVTWIFGISFFGLVAHDKQLYSEAGSNTIYPYCLQVWYLKFMGNLLNLLTGATHYPNHVWYAMPVWAVNFCLVPMVNLLFAHRWVRKWSCFIFNPTWAMKLVGFADPDKFLAESENPRAPDMMTHCISFLGLFTVTSGVLFIGGGVRCIMNQDAPGALRCVTASFAAAHALTPSRLRRLHARRRVKRARAHANISGAGRAPAGRCARHTAAAQPRCTKATIVLTQALLEPAPRLCACCRF
jgi:fucose 4-O-acetylase-like acetyltransferase